MRKGALAVLLKTKPTLYKERFEQLNIKRILKIGEHDFQKKRNYFIAKCKELKVVEFIVIV